MALAFLALLTATVAVVAHGRRSAAADAPPSRSVLIGPRPAGAVPPAPVTWATTLVAMPYGGLARSYLIVRPISGTNGKLPVVVMLHGHSVTPEVEEARDDWQDVAGPAVIVLPTGTGPAQMEGWDAGNCCGYPVDHDIDDEGFIEAVVARVLATTPEADSSRVYLAGYSNGGKMALVLACDDPTRWRAVAVYGTTSSEHCPAQTPLSFLFAGSTADGEIDLDSPGAEIKDPDGFAEPTVDQEVAFFSDADRCGQPVTSVDGVLTTTTRRCADGRVVEEDLYAGGSHALPVADGPAPGVITLMWHYFATLGA